MPEKYYSTRKKTARLPWPNSML